MQVITSYWPILQRKYGGLVQRSQNGVFIESSDKNSAAIAAKL